MIRKPFPDFNRQTSDVDLRGRGSLSEVDGLKLQLLRQINRATLGSRRAVRAIIRSALEYHDESSDHPKAGRTARRSTLRRFFFKFFSQWATTCPKHVVLLLTSRKVSTQPCDLSILSHHQIQQVAVCGFSAMLKVPLSWHRFQDSNVETFRTLNRRPQPPRSPLSQ